MTQTDLSVRETAAVLVGLLRNGEFAKAQTDLFAEDIISIDLPGQDGKALEIKGLAAILDRTQQFQAAVESVQGLKVSEPVVAGNAIAVEFVLDFTPRGSAATRLAEIIIYVVKDGKIVHEQFFN